MAKITYIYKGKRRPEKHGIKKSYDSKELTPKKKSSLIEKGWEEVKVATKSKAKKKSKGEK